MVTRVWSQHTTLTITYLLQPGSTPPTSTPGHIEIIDINTFSVRDSENNNEAEWDSQADIFTFQLSSSPSPSALHWTGKQGVPGRQWSGGESYVPQRHSASQDSQVRQQRQGETGN